MTEYHGDEVTTEYLLTVDVAKAILRRAYPEVRVEYRVNQIRRHALIHDESKPFTLGSRRFDVAILDAGVPIFVVEIKIGVSSLSGELKKDLLKIITYLDYLKPSYASRVLGACVFQTYVKARKPRSVPQATKRIHDLERKVKDGLDAFAVANPLFEFEWRAFQGSNDRIHDDEVIEDVDGAPMLGRPGYAARYHAILVRRRE